MLSTFDTQGLKQRPFRHVKRDADRPLDPDPWSLHVNLLAATKEARPYFGLLYQAFPWEYTNGMDRAETRLGQPILAQGRSRPAMRIGTPGSAKGAKSELSDLLSIQHNILLDSLFVVFEALLKRTPALIFPEIEIPAVSNIWIALQ